MYLEQTGIREKKETEPRKLEVRDNVRIKNPGKYSASQGVIVKIIKSRVTVETETGQQMMRATKNVITTGGMTP